MPIDRKARSQAVGGYTFLTAGKKYSFSRYPAGRKEPSSARRKNYRADVPSAIDDRGHHGADTIATKGPQLARHDTLQRRGETLSQINLDVPRLTAHLRHCLL